MATAAAAAAATAVVRSQRPRRRPRASPPSRAAGRDARRDPETREKKPALIIPGFLSGFQKYEEMRRLLESSTLGLGPIAIAPVTIADWVPTLLGGDFRGILDKVDGAADELLSRSKARKIAIVGHSAGGWLARTWLGRAPYSGGKRYRGVDRCDVLLTLGTPHYSLEAYPFGRIEERRAGDGLDEDLADVDADDARADDTWTHDDTWTPERARGSTLALTNLRYPGAFERGVRYVSVCGAGENGADFDLLALLRGGAGDAKKDALRSMFVGVSYEASTGSSPRGVDGDGVTPIARALLDGSETLVLNGVAHQPGGEDDAPWYGSPGVVEKWAPLLVAAEDDEDEDDDDDSNRRD
jgi:hypothetical protein